ncbi:MAG: hypothetical protein G01um101419_570 [Parcubacteria group bacterium Gr01-1014_19]|nr:MAG: hypothetical protein G01um101419_570 [Parcubacteria group bacterium Gr01-1014_19]
MNKPATTPPVQDWLETMPESIREWLGSNSLLYLIINLNNRLGLQGIKSAVVPDLILQIAIKELRPKDLPDRLSKELGLDREMAFNITKEIEEKMLRPIEVPLRNELGVDIKEIYAEKLQAPRIAAIPAMPNQPIYKPAANPTPAIPVRPTPPPTPPKPITPSDLRQTTNDRPQTTKAPIVELPVKINVKSARPDQGGKPEDNNPFGADSWVSKLK